MTPRKKLYEGPAPYIEDVADVLRSYGYTKYVDLRSYLSDGLTWDCDTSRVRSMAEEIAVLRKFRSEVLKAAGK